MSNSAGGPSTTLAKRDRDTSGTFLGSAVAKYDVDELDDLGRAPKAQQYVEVRRPDGTIAKSRGERTFYGAFTGGFTAGYWGTVGSKEGWEPAAFASSRTKRETQGPAASVEDLMDEEDLRDHRASHRTLETRRDFAGPAKAAEGSGHSLLGGLPRELREDLFGAEQQPLGARLLRAGADPEVAGAAQQAQERRPTLPGKRKYGCALPPPAGLVQASATDSADVAQAGQAEEQGQLGLDWEFKLAGAAKVRSAASDRKLEAELERLWQAKTDLHGVGYGLGQAASSRKLPEGRRLYMSAKRGRNLNQGKDSSYGDFGTGVFDQDDYDAWDDIYDASDKHTHYHPALKDDDVDDAIRAASLPDAQGGSRVPSARDGVPGFSPAATSDEFGPDVSAWLSPRPPRGYRGIYVAPGPILEEARCGSKEHRVLLDFLDKHGDRRFINPSARAELLGMRSRPSAALAAELGGQPAGTAPASASSAPPGAPGFPPEPPLPGQAASAGDIAARAAQPLWKGVDTARKEQLLESLGRSFVTGKNQDMDGRSGRHQPFKSDSAKQKRYASFCLAMEGKASAVEALADTGGLREAERQAELEEFGRVFRMFKQQHPDADVASALDGGDATAPPAMQRTVHAWVPDRLLCKRWGVPEPKPRLEQASASRRHAEQVQLGLSGALAGAAGEAAAAAAGEVLPPHLPAKGFSRPAPPPPDLPAQGFSPPAALPPGLPAQGFSPQAEPPRPPKSLFASIFGDAASDDEV